jgi:hypothetical protein
LSYKVPDQQQKKNIKQDTPEVIEELIELTIIFSSSPSSPKKTYSHQMIAFKKKKSNF